MVARSGGPAADESRFWSFDADAGLARQMLAKPDRLYPLASFANCAVFKCQRSTHRLTLVIGRQQIRSQSAAQMPRPGLR